MTTTTNWQYVELMRERVATGRKAPPSLQIRGWSWETTDLCWMRCDRAGYRNTRVIGSDVIQEIVLCGPHAIEYEAEQVLLQGNPHFPFVRDGLDPTPNDRWWPWRTVFPPVAGQTKEESR